MSIGSTNLATTNLDGMDNEQLFAQLSKSKEELFNLRFQAATDRIDNHGRLKAVRRDIARINTVLRERELNIRTAPSTSVKSDVKSTTKTDAKKSVKTTDNKKETK